MGEIRQLVWVLALLSLLLGVGLGALFFAQEKQVFIPQTIEKEVVVEKEVPVPVHTDYVKEAADLFLEKLSTDSDFDKYLVCDRDRYEANQVSVSRIYEKARVAIDDVSTDDRTHAAEEIVTFEIRLKYADADTQDKCYENFDVEVTHTEGEESTIKVK